MHFSSPWFGLWEFHQLAEGNDIVIRAATPADVDGLLAYYAGLGRRDCKLRFQGSPMPSRGDVERWVRSRSVVVCRESGASDVLGEGRYTGSGHDRARIEFSVGKPWRRRGVGRLLVGALERWANVRRVEAYVRRPNRAAIALLTSKSVRFEKRGQAGRTVKFELDLGPERIRK